MASGQWRVLSAALTVSIPITDAVADEFERKYRAAAVSRCTKVEPAPGTPSVPGGYLFGLTDPTDPGDPCTWELAFESHARYGKRDGRYLGVTSKLEVGYTYSQHVAFALAAYHTYTRWSDVALCQDSLAGEGDGVSAAGLSKHGADGVSAELFVRVLSRSPGQPLAAAVAIEPRWGRIDNLTGHQATGYGGQFKLLLDAPITEKLYAAVNVSYGLGQQKLAIPNAQWSRASFAVATVAVSHEVYTAEKRFIERIMVGAEGVGVLPFNGLVLNHYDGYAFFFGPTLGIGFQGDRFLSIVWLPQIAGHARFSKFSGARDLDHGERHELRVKFATPFSM
jgi:hypothetical protein